MKRKAVILISSFFYSGYFPVASGTAGTLAFLPFYYFLFKDMNPVIYALCTFIIILAGIWASNYAIVIYKSNDPKKVVIDEVAGYMMTMLFIPFTPARMAIGFLLSRFFDIVKFYPARQAESFDGGTGIMMDDVVAGAQANIAMWIIVLSGADTALLSALKNVFGN